MRNVLCALLCVLAATASAQHSGPPFDARMAILHMSYSGVLYPPTKADYYQQAPDAATYRRELTQWLSTFKERGVICAAAEVLQPAKNTEGTKVFLPILREECKRFPYTNAELYAAIDAIQIASPDPQGPHANDKSFWLTSAMRLEKIAASRLSVDERRKKFVAIVRDYERPHTLTDMRTILRAVSLMPQDEAAVYGALRGARSAPISGRPRVEPADVDAFFLKLYSDESALNAPSAIDWKRGLAALLFYRGEYEKAGKVADEIVKGAQQPTSRDLILASLIQFLAGKSEALTSAVKKCSSTADLRFVEQYGAPATPKEYCNAILHTLASRAAMVQGGKAPPRLRNVIVTTGTADVHERLASTTPQAPVRTATHDELYTSTLDRLVKVAQKSAASVATLSPEQRLRTAERKAQSASSGTLESYTEVLAIWPTDAFLDPAYELAAHRSSVPGTQDAHHARLAALKTLIESMAQSAPNHDETQWKYALSAFHAFSGDFVRARDLAREVSRSKKPQDRVVLPYYGLMHVILERAVGNPQPYFAYVKNCPPPTQSFLDNTGAPRSKTHYCESRASVFVSRLARYRGEKTPPGVVDIAREMATQVEPGTFEQNLAAHTLIQVNSKAARAILEQELSRRTRKDHKAVLLTQLSAAAATAKDHEGVLAYTDSWLKQSAQQGGRSAPLWRELKRAPLVYPDYELTNVLRNRVAAAHALRRASVIRDAVERFAVEELTIDAQIAMFRLVDVLLATNRKADAKRILGYLETFENSPVVAKEMTGYRNALGLVIGEHFPSQLTPWDSAADSPPRATARS